MSVLAGVMNADDFDDFDDFESSIVDCDICDFLIDVGPEDDYCTGHEGKCPNYGLKEQIVDCECSIFYHPHCCPICNKEKEE